VQIRDIDSLCGFRLQFPALPLVGNGVVLFQSAVLAIENSDFPHHNPFLCGTITLFCAAENKLSRPRKNNELRTKFPMGFATPPVYT
jgi:hypothetical protein